MSKIAVGYMVTDDRENDYPLVKFVFDDETLANDFINQYNSAIKYTEDRLAQLEEKRKNIKESFIFENTQPAKTNDLNILKNSKSEANKKYIQICKDTKDNNSPDAVKALDEMKYFDKLIAKEQKNVDNKKKN